MQSDAEAAVATVLDVAPDAIALNAYAITELRRTARDLASLGAPGVKEIRDSLRL